MKRFLVVAVVIIVAVIGAIAVLGPKWRDRVKPVAKPAGPVSAVGYVVDVDGRPVVGAKVYAVTGPAMGLFGNAEAGKAVIRGTAVTGRGGGFVFRGLPDTLGCADYYLIVQVPGKSLGWAHCPVEYMDQTPMCPNPNIDYRIMVGRLGKQKGRVVDTDGKPVAGARVGLAGIVQPEPRSYDSLLVSPCIGLVMKIPKDVTDSSGCYELSGIPADCRYTVSAVKRGMVVYRRWYRDSGADTVLISRKKQHLCEGCVLDRHGRPVAGAKVFAYSDPNMSMLNMDTATTGRDGRYVMEYVGGHNFFAEKGITFFMPKIVRDSRQVPASQDRPGTRVKMPDLVEARMPVISGRVLQAGSGKPVSGAVVVTSAAYHWQGPWSQRAVSDASGCYRLRLPVGRQLLHFESGNPWHTIYPKAIGKIGWNTWVDLPEAGIKGYDMELVQAETVKGRVVDPDGVAVKGALISLGETPANWTRSKGDGSFELPLHGGNNRPLMSQLSGLTNLLTLRVRDDSHKRSCSVYVDSERVGKQMKVVVMPQAKVRIVVHDLDGKAVKGAIVSVDQSRPKKTDSNGYSLFDGLMNLPAYSARVTKPGYLQASDDDLAAITGKEVQPTAYPAKVDKDGIYVVETTMVPTREVQKGKVVDVNGKPIAGMTVDIRFGMPPRAPIQTMTSSNGEFALRNVPSVPAKIIAGNPLTRTGSAMSGPEYVVIKVRNVNFGGHVVFVGGPKPRPKTAN